MRINLAAALSVAICASAAVSKPSIPGVSARPRSALDLVLGAVPEQRACPTSEPSLWRDASDARFFATGATARFDEQELAANTLAPLISLRLAGGVPRLLLLGSPIRFGLRFTTTGWRPRWPFC